MRKLTTLDDLNRQVIRCKKCPRLHSYIHKVAAQKTKRFSSEKYWGKPLPSFGDTNSHVLIVGLAPAAHGGNRTGRMFTGDSSGDWVAKVLFDNGFATKSVSQHKNDGFSLINCYITAAVRCAPPENKPTKEEIMTCSELYLTQELSILKNIQIIVCLCKIDFDTISNILQIEKPTFSHGHLIKHNNLYVLCSYHPSKQNTQTRRLGWDQWNAIFVKTREILNSN